MHSTHGGAASYCSVMSFNTLCRRIVIEVACDLSFNPDAITNPDVILPRHCVRLEMIIFFDLVASSAVVYIKYLPVLEPDTLTLQFFGLLHPPSFSPWPAVQSWHAGGIVSVHGCNHLAFRPPY